MEVVVKGDDSRKHTTHAIGENGRQNNSGISSQSSSMTFEGIAPPE